MFEKVNPFHPDKVADRIAGAITDLAYDIAGGPDSNPKIATEVLIGHGCGQIIIETSVPEAPLVAGLPGIMKRICPDIKPEFTNVRIVKQDPHLAANQDGRIRCGDNGIFRGMPLTSEQRLLSQIEGELTRQFQSDGKYIIDDETQCLIICQSNAKTEDIRRIVEQELAKPYINRLGFYDIIINPLGDWTGGTDVDSGATNRKLGSDMGDAVTGGGLHGKDLSKADVSVNIMCHILALESGQKVEACCAIGDEDITFCYANGGSVTRSFAEVVAEARDYIKSNHYDFETFAMNGLI